MNKFLVSTLFLLGSFGVVFGFIAANSTNSITPVTLSAVQNDWPYCNEPPAIVPFFDPCPEGSHVDKDCADKCGIEYQEKVARIMQVACQDSWILYLQLLVDIDTAASNQFSCVALGGSQDFCHKVYNDTLLRLDTHYGIDRDKIATKVAKDVQKALDNYYDCLLACSCIQNGIVR